MFLLNFIKICVYEIIEYYYIDDNSGFEEMIPKFFKCEWCSLFWLITKLVYNSFGDLL